MDSFNQAVSVDKLLNKPAQQYQDFVLNACLSHIDNVQSKIRNQELNLRLFKTVLLHIHGYLHCEAYEAAD